MNSVNMLFQKGFIVVHTVALVTLNLHLQYYMLFINVIIHFYIRRKV